MITLCGSRNFFTVILLMCMVFKSSLFVMIFSCIVGIVYAGDVSANHRTSQRYSTQAQQDNSEVQQSSDERDIRNSTIYSTRRHRDIRHQQLDKQTSHSMDAEASVKWSYQQRHQDDEQK